MLLGGYFFFAAFFANASLCSRELIPVILRQNSARARFFHCPRAPFPILINLLFDFLAHFRAKYNISYFY